MKTKRHARILELIQAYEIETQEELAERLNAEGVRVTQATVSRDIRELRLSKTSSNGKQKYTLLEDSSKNLEEKYLRILKDGMVSMEMAQNILVIKTVAGMAMAVAAAVDAMKMEEIVGSIAGDDTIMCAVKSVDDTLLVIEKIKKILD